MQSVQRQTTSLVTETEVIHVETTIRAASRVIDFREIWAAARIEPDAEYDPFDCDGLEHGQMPAAQMEEIGPDGAHACRGYWHNGREWGVIQIDPADVANWGNYDYYRANGFSKQAAAEAVAEEIGRTIDYIVKWYRGEGAAYGVVCEYMGEHDSCWGYEPYDYAQEQRTEHAMIVADQLEEQGYIIENRPAPVLPSRAHIVIERSRQMMKG